MSDEELVAALAEVLDNTATGLWMNQDAARRGDRTWGHVVAAALLPTVRHIAEQRAAEDLLAAADDWELRGLWFTANELRARAAALTATPNHGRNAT